MLPSMIPEASSPDPTPAPAASAQTLMAQVYTQLRGLAVFKMGHQPPGQTIQATALVHEVWLKLSKDQPGSGPTRGSSSPRPPRPCARFSLIAPATAPVRDETLIGLDEALAELAKAGLLKAEVVNMRFFVGMTANEIAELLGVNERTVERHWVFAKAWLFKQLPNG